MGRYQRDRRIRSTRPGSDKVGQHRDDNEAISISTLKVGALSTMKLEASGAFKYHVHQKACNLANNTYILETKAQTVHL